MARKGGNLGQMQFCRCNDDKWSCWGKYGAVISILLFSALLVFNVYFQSLAPSEEDFGILLKEIWLARFAHHVWKYGGAGITIFVTFWGSWLLREWQLQTEALQFRQEMYTKLAQPPDLPHLKLWLFHPNAHVRCYPLPNMVTEEEWLQTLSLICLEADDLLDSTLRDALAEAVRLARRRFRSPIWEDLARLLSKGWTCRSVGEWAERIAAWPFALHENADGHIQMITPSVRGLQIWALGQLIFRKDVQDLSQMPESVWFLLRDQRLLSLARELGYEVDMDWLRGPSSCFFARAVSTIFSTLEVRCLQGEGAPPGTSNRSPTFFLEEDGRIRFPQSVRFLWEPPKAWPEGDFQQHWWLVSTSPWDIRFVTTYILETLAQPESTVFPLAWVFDDKPLQQGGFRQIWLRILAENWLRHLAFWPLLLLEMKPHQRRGFFRLLETVYGDKAIVKSRYEVFLSQVHSLLQRLSSEMQSVQRDFAVARALFFRYYLETWRERPDASASPSWEDFWPHLRPLGFDTTLLLIWVPRGNETAFEQWLEQDALALDQWARLGVFLRVFAQNEPTNSTSFRVIPLRWSSQALRNMLEQWIHITFGFRTPWEGLWKPEQRAEAEAVWQKALQYADGSFGRFLQSLAKALEHQGLL